MDRLSVAQSATVLGVTQAAVYKRIQRGLQGRKASGKEVNLMWVKRTKELFAAFIVGNGV
jgi:predicted transcriptional regulator